MPLRIPAYFPGFFFDLVFLTVFGDFFFFFAARCCGGLFATTSAARSKRAHASGYNSTSSFGRCLLMKKTIQRVTGKARYDLPPSLSREVGRILVHWAYFEHIVQETIWETLKITPQAG